MTVGCFECHTLRDGEFGQPPPVKSYLIVIPGDVFDVEIPCQNGEDV